MGYPIRKVSLESPKFKITFYIIKDNNKFCDIK